MNACLIPVPFCPRVVPGFPGLIQTLVTWDFGATLAADAQRYFGVKCINFRRMGL